MKKKLVFLALLLLSAAVFFYIRAEKTARLDVQLGSESYFEGLKIINKKNGATAWTLTARRADLSQDGREAQLHNVVMKLGKDGITVEAEKGLYDMDSKKVFIEGVITAQSDNYVITTSGANVDSTGGTLNTDSDVHIEGKKFNLEGTGMQADNTQQKVRILNNVKATFNR